MNRQLKVTQETHARLMGMGKGMTMDEKIAGLLDMWDNLQAGKTISITRVTYAMPEPSAQPVPYLEANPADVKAQG